MHGDDARHRGLADAVKARHLGPRLAPGDDTFGDFPSLGVIEFIRPSALAAASPADVRSQIIARSNSAKAPTICIIIRPAGVVVSMFSVTDRNPAPALPIRSMMCSTSFKERDRRSSFHTTTVSPSSRWSSETHRFGRYAMFGLRSCPWLLSVRF